MICQPAAYNTSTHIIFCQYSTYTEHILHIKIYSSGPGALSCSIENSYFPKQRNDISGSGIGLEQVQKRLDLIYPCKYEWTKGCDENATVYKSILTIHTTTK